MEESLKWLINYFDLLYTKLLPEIGTLVFFIALAGSKYILVNLKSKLGLLFKLRNYDKVNTQLINMVNQIDADRAYVAEYNVSFSPANKDLCYSVITEVNKDGVIETAENRQNVPIKNGTFKFFKDFTKDGYSICNDINEIKNENLISRLEMFDVKSFITFAIKDKDGKIMKSVTVDFTTKLHSFTEQDIKELRPFVRKIKATFEQ